MASPILERRFFPKGVVVFKQGDERGSAFLIQSGKVVVYDEHDGARVDLAVLEAGQIFGETALITAGERTASVEALEDTTLIVITRQIFEEKLKRSDPTIKALVEMLSRRLESSNDVVVDKKSSPEDLRRSARAIYQNILAGLPQNQQAVFQSEVLPQLEAFLNALGVFESRYLR